MQVDQHKLDIFVEMEEGVKPRVYKDSGGAPTIAVGHLLTRSERRSGKIIINGVPVPYANGLTEQQCMDLLSQDLEPVEEVVNDYVEVELTENQYDALVSFTFNVGDEAFQDSTLLKLLNQGQYDQVPIQMARWIHDNGEVIQGLINRRNKEIALWNSN